MIMNLIIVIFLVLFINIPFGYWRSKVKRFSPKWFLAVHLPIPLVVFLRISFGLGFKLYTFPFILGAYFAGQSIGGRLENG